MEMLKRQYFAMVPVRDIQWQETIPDWKFFSQEKQEELLLSTILHQKSLSFPVTISYNRAFMKRLISECEMVGTEVIDEFYEIYTTLVAQPEGAEGEYCYKTYFLNECTDISLAESRSLISQGTTGLQTWQAAKFLAEWVIENKEQFENKNFLELGSGLGLLGLITCQLCHLQTFNFTDCHESVLKLLAHNIEINCKNNSEDQDDSQNLQENMRLFTESFHKTTERNKNLTDTLQAPDVNDVLWSRVTGPMQCWNSLQDPRISLTKLDWEECLEEELFEMFANVDVTLASDVVFDSRIIPALVKVMSVLVRKPQSVIYIASTVRNPITRDEFLKNLDEANLKYDFIKDIPAAVFFYDKSVRIELLKISLS